MLGFFLDGFLCGLAQVDLVRRWWFVGARIDAQQLDLEHHVCVGRYNATGAVAAVGEVVRQRQALDLALTHVRQTALPPFDHLARAQLELRKRQEGQKSE
eukprot:TRINITY_DN3668_c0_g1_i2.p1 TRINITY_DN3668_c0_g1~~TRINITY_DN3668_c0_g1_i2.p1  ORF type:complete len:100 (+),score=10.60 TRINITY_DN3668_c0_g1_i2:44-343(+)